MNASIPASAQQTPSPLASRGKRRRRALALALLVVFIAGLLWPEAARIPVHAATPKDWHPQSFWYHPWGESGVHKGIDIFAPTGRPAIAAVPGLVLYQGQLRRGGKVVAVLGPKWRVHYYAHLDRIDVSSFDLLKRGEPVGTVGTTGNAAGKPPHLHYAVVSLVPLPWRIDMQRQQGWKLAFFLDPGALIAAERSGINQPGIDR